MTAYVGEEFRISSAPLDFDHGRPLTPDDVAGMSVTVWNAAADVVVDDQPMIWNDELEFFYYLWDTTGLSAGSYKAKVVIMSVTGRQNWEWKRIRLKADPVPVPVP